MNEKLCEVCGSKLVSIRGRYPKTESRLVCACCAVEKLEHIHEISSVHYGRAYINRGRIYPEEDEISEDDYIDKNK